MLRKALLSAIVAAFVFAIGSSTTSAQGVDYNNWTRTNHGAAPQVDKWGIPCPTGGCQKMINQARHRKLKQVQADRPTPDHPDARGWDGVGQDPDKIPFSKDTPDPDDADMVDQPSNGSVLGHRNIPK